MKSKAAAVAAFAVITGITAGIRGEDAISVRVRPTVATAPADVHVEALVQPSEANRVLEIVLDSTEFYRASRIPLAGARAPRLSGFDFPGVPSGAYIVTATVMTASGDTSSAFRRMDIGLAGR